MLPSVQLSRFVDRGLRNRGNHPGRGSPPSAVYGARKLAWWSTSEEEPMTNAEKKLKAAALLLRVGARTHLKKASDTLGVIAQKYDELATARDLVNRCSWEVEWACEDEEYLKAARNARCALRDVGLAVRRFQECLSQVPPDAVSEKLQLLHASILVERHVVSMLDPGALRRLASRYRELQGEWYLFGEDEKFAAQIARALGEPVESGDDE